MYGSKLGNHAKLCLVLRALLTSQARGCVRIDPSGLLWILVVFTSLTSEK